MVCNKKNRLFSKEELSKFNSDRAKIQNFERYRRYISLWKRGLVSGGQKEGYGKVSNHVRKYLLEKYENKCSACGWNSLNTFTNTIPLEVEHIDGNPENHSESNLTILCPNCHSLTSNHSTSKGKGRRYYRNKYMKERRDG